MNDENLKGSLSLRNQAEQRLDSVGSVMQGIDGRGPRALIHELQVHQIELEMQNEELRCTQHQLEEERQRYQDFYEFTPVGYLTLDEKGIILELNLSAAGMLGDNRSSIIKRPLVRFFSPDSRYNFNLFLQRIFSGKNFERCELQLGDGLDKRTVIHVEGIVTGNDKGLTKECRLVMSDITGIKQSEENLHRYKLLAEHSRDMILFVRCDDGRILEANTAVVNTYGYGREELLGLTVKELRAPEAMEQTAAQIAEADDNGILFETIHRRRDGRTFPVEVSSQGTIVNGTRTLISVIRDITERKRAEELIQKHVEELRTSNEDLEHFNNASVGRELRMIELKEEINELCTKAGLPQKYDVDIIEDQS